ncbi:hypothetical protein BCD_0851 (plasmid) [Borrelia crocidurae DOU]|uniref:Uncharacterized protein n=1 Tax=Borrelia crocidurae DOU TaxID=1293575 RepID=W5SJ19_9SPIR|nr:hypothetical protein BCD_0851 [Borrelia crocidurae DOU]
MIIRTKVENAVAKFEAVNAVIIAILSKKNINII